MWLHMSCILGSGLFSFVTQIRCIRGWIKLFELTDSWIYHPIHDLYIQGHCKPGSPSFLSSASSLLLLPLFLHLHHPTFSCSMRPRAVFQSGVILFANWSIDGLWEATACCRLPSLHRLPLCCLWHPGFCAFGLHPLYCSSSHCSFQVVLAVCRQLIGQLLSFILHFPCTPLFLQGILFHHISFHIKTNNS